MKYVRKKIDDGSLESWKKDQFLEVANMRDMEEHCGGGRFTVNKFDSIRAPKFGAKQTSRNYIFKYGKRN